MDGSIHRGYKAVKRFINNLIYYWPLLWDDRWYSDGYMLRWIEAKARRDAYLHAEYGMLERHMQTARELQEIADICHRLQDEDSYWLGISTDIINGPEVYQIFNDRIQIDLNRLGELMKQITHWWD